MERLFKTFEIKADSEDFGTISGYFSTYDRIPDSYGDVVKAGAFSDTLKAIEKSGHPLPLCWNHDLNQIIGTVDEIKDTEKGPFMKASFFGNELAQEKREIVKSGCVYQFSFAYEVLEAGSVSLEDGTKANELRKLNLFEVSIVPIPANPRAVMTDVKAKIDDDTKEVIKDYVTELFNQLKEEENPEGKDKADANAKAEEQKQSNPKKDALLNFINKINS